MGAVHRFLYIIFADGITQHHEHFIIINNTAGHLYSMPDTLPVCLVYKMRLNVRIFLPDVVLYLITEVAYNKNEFMYACFLQLVNNYAQHIFSCQWYKGLGLSICMRTELCTCASNGDNGLHYMRFVN